MQESRRRAENVKYSTHNTQHTHGNHALTSRHTDRTHRERRASAPVDEHIDRVYTTPNVVAILVVIVNSQRGDADDAATATIVMAVVAVVAAVAVVASSQFEFEPLARRAVAASRR